MLARRRRGEAERMRSGIFEDEGSLIGGKCPELRHAEPAALLNHQWFVILLTYFLHPEETHWEWV